MTDRSESWHVRFARHLWPDNVAAYILLILAIIVAILNLAGITSDKVSRGLVMSVLGLLIVNIIRDRAERAKLTESLKELLNRSDRQSADRFFSRQTQEQVILGRAHRSVRILQETGSLVLEKAQDQIIRLLNVGGEVRIIVTLPARSPASNLAFRNANLVSTAGIETRLSQFAAQMAGVIAGAKDNTDRLQLRYTAYDCGYTSIITDGDLIGGNNSDGFALIRIAGFRIPYARKLDFEMASGTSPISFAHFMSEFDDLFACCSKIMLLSADPRVGKTKLIQELLSGEYSEEDVYFAISEGVYDAGKRVGFTARTSSSSNPRTFATLRPGVHEMPGDIAKYDLRSELWDQIAKEIESARASHKVIVVDEVGKMQLQNPAFREILETIMLDPLTTLFATIPADHHTDAFIDRLVQNPRATRIHLSRDNEKDTLALLKRELEGAVRLTRHLKVGMQDEHLH